MDVSAGASFSSWIEIITVPEVDNPAVSNACTVKEYMLICSKLYDAEVVAKISIKLDLSYSFTSDINISPLLKQPLSPTVITAWLNTAELI